MLPYVLKKSKMGLIGIPGTRVKGERIGGGEGGKQIKLVF